MSELYPTIQVIDFTLAMEPMEEHMNEEYVKQDDAESISEDASSIKDDKDRHDPLDSDKELKAETPKQKNAKPVKSKKDNERIDTEKDLKAERKKQNKAKSIRRRKDSDRIDTDKELKAEGPSNNDNDRSREDEGHDDSDHEDDGTRVVLSNNFMMTLESTDTPCNATGTETKKHKEKKNGRFYKFVKRHFLQRKHNSNDVREIHIVPEGDEFRWARRSAGSAASRSSEETTSSEGDRLEVVHDMAEEYISD